MRKLLPVVTILVAVCFAMCKPKATISENPGDATDSAPIQPIIEVDLNGNDYPKKDLYIQDIADVRYLALETTDKSLIQHIYNVAIRDNKIIITDKLTSQILVFDSIGNYLTKIARHGSGPHDYMFICNSAVDFDSEVVYVEDMNDYKVYDYDGYLIKKISKSNKKGASDLYLVDSDRLIAYYETNGMREEGDTLGGNYYYIDTNTGHRTRIDIDIPDPASNNFMITENGVTTSRGLDINTMMKSDGKVIISDYIYPTVFQSSSSGMNPIIERMGTDSKGQDSRVLTSVAYISDPYIIFRYIKVSGVGDIKKFGISKDRDLIYDRKTNTIVEGQIYNKDMDIHRACGKAWGYDLPANTIVQVLPIEPMHKLNDEGRLSGPLKEMIDTIDIEANDILMIATLKSK